MGQDDSAGDSASRPRRPRVERSKRSRNGCSTCISKKVKCDETRPFCARCIRLHLTCEWPPPKPPLASRRRGYGPMKSRDQDLWSPSSIVPKFDASSSSPQSGVAAPIATNCLPSPGFEDMFHLEDFVAEGATDDNEVLVNLTSSTETHPNAINWAFSADGLVGTPASYLAQMSENNDACLESAYNANAFELLAAPLMDPLIDATDLSFAYATGTTPALGSDDKQAVLFHYKVFAPLKSTRDWTCSAHTLFLNKAFNRDMALHFLLAVSHSELAIHYGRGSQPPQESREHFERGSQLLLRSHNPFAAPDHVGMMLSFLYMYMFWMRRDHLDPIKLRELSRAVLVHVRTYGLDTLCASDDVLSYGEDTCIAAITVSEQVLLARIMAYLYDRDGFCCFFGCGGDFADYLNRISQKRHRIWLRSRAAFFLPLGGVSEATGANSEIEDAATLDIYFELIILHQEINFYSQTHSINITDLRSKLQQRLDAIYNDQSGLFQQVADRENGHRCTLMAYVTATFFYALRIYFHRARVSSFGTRPIPCELQDAISSLMSTAFYAIQTGPVQLLERFQWSLFIAGLEVTDPVHHEWLESNLSDPAIKKGFNYIQTITRKSQGDINMEMIRSLIDKGFLVP
ncbi:hypothetical protein BJX70DRAFT_389730 [Aspergillus crustosus]